MSTETGTGQLVGEEALGRYLDDALGGPHQPTTVERHVAGFSNVTVYVRRGSTEYVLRRPPPGPLLPTSHDVSREYRFLKALADTPVRVPRPAVLCEDSSVIGAPFYLMERKYGEVVRGQLPANLGATGERRRIGGEMVDALVELHAVDWRAVGLEGRPEGYITRQLKRWQGQADLTVGKVRDLPGLQEIGDWLRAHQPAEGPATIVHGDYKLDNVMFAAEAPARLNAIFDWEMATIGDPLADLGYLMNSWGAPVAAEAGDEVPVTALPGFLTRDELARRYAERTGREMHDVTFYFVLAMWKGIVIVEGLYVLYMQGAAANPGAAEFEQRVPRQIRRALAVIAHA